MDDVLGQIQYLKNKNSECRPSYVKKSIANDSLIIKSFQKKKNYTRFLYTVCTFVTESSQEFQAFHVKNLFLKTYMYHTFR